MIAIIILNWNGLTDTLECLNSIVASEEKNYKIYVVDNASDDDELPKIIAFAKKNHQEIIPIQNKSNLGFAEGNNVAIQRALQDDAEYIFTLNNDTVIHPQALSFLISSSSFTTPSDSFVTPTPSFVTRSASFVISNETLSSQTKLCHPERSEGSVSSPVNTDHIGITVPTMINYYDRDRIDNTGHDLLSCGDSIPRDRGRTLPHASTHPPLGACAGAALYSSKMLRDIGLFDPDFFLNYEDADLSLRALVRGWKITSSPNSIIYHKLNRSIRKIKNSEYRIRSQRNQLLAYFHNIPLVVILLNLPGLLLRDLGIVLTSLLSLRLEITHIFLKSRWEFLKDWRKIVKKRRKVLAHQKISSLWLWRHQRSWIPVYVGYFWEIILKRKGSVMED